MGVDLHKDTESDNTSYVDQAVLAAARFSPEEHARFWAKVDRGPEDACWLWRAALDPRGYGQLTISRFSRGPLKAHRVAYALTHGAVPAGACILHACDEPRCVNPRHLRAGTQRENIHESIQKGRWRAPGRRLTPARRDALLAAVADGARQADVARMFGVSQATVNRHVANRKQAGRR
jgi:DNA-binding CsgD family transcriptional regulator